MQRGGWRRGAALGLVAAVLATVVLVAGLLSGCAGGSKAQATAETQAPTQANQAAGTEGSAGSVRAPAGDVILRIRGAVRHQAIPGGFVGLSLEYPAVAAYAGTDPSAVNPVFLQLIRNLNPGQLPVLRIGGDSTDWTWWPVVGDEPAGRRQLHADPGLRLGAAQPGDDARREADPRHQPGGGQHERGVG